MRRKWFDVEQMIGVLKQAEVGIPVAEVIRKVGFCDQTFLTVEGEVCQSGSGLSLPDGPTARREPTAGAACGRVDSGTRRCCRASSQKEVEPSGVDLLRRIWSKVTS